MVAKISADKGVLFDFANSQKLKDSGFALDGKIINGYVSKDDVTVNIDSAKALNSVVGHEITHILEGKAIERTKLSLARKNADGIEVYETSQDIMNLTWAERKSKYLDVMNNEIYLTLLKIRSIAEASRTRKTIQTQITLITL